MIPYGCTCVAIATVADLESNRINRRYELTMY